MVRDFRRSQCLIDIANNGKFSLIFIHRGLKFGDDHGYFRGEKTMVFDSKLQNFQQLLLEINAVWILEIGYYRNNIFIDLIIGKSFLTVFFDDYQHAFQYFGYLWINLFIFAPYAFYFPFKGFMQVAENLTTAPGYELLKLVQ